MMELAEENGFAGQALSAQPDFSARNALSHNSLSFAEKLLDEKKLEVFGEESRVNYRLSDGEHILQLNLTAVFRRIVLLIVVILSSRQPTGAKPRFSHMNN